MKNLIIGITFIVITCACTHAVPVLIWDGISLFEQTEGNEYSILTTLFPSSDLYFLTGFEVFADSEGASLVNPSGLAGYSYRFVEMEFNDLVDADGIWSRIAFDSNFGVDYGNTVDVYLRTGECFYFGIQLSKNEDNMFAFYGWMELMWDGEKLNMLSSAAEITGLGIYCGEFRAVPEPGTAGLLLLGGAGLLGMRRRRCNENRKAKS